jgi:molybdopterin-guanine dinucleotide biosynthesis protein A
MQSQGVARSHEPTAGILLAGGRATRMGGGDKALRPLGGIPLLARVITILRPQCDTLVISANGKIARFAEFGLPIVADEIEDYAGPLAGILAGLDFLAARQPQAPLAVSVSSDTPFLPADLVARLHAARTAAGADIACARSGGAIHPVIALWPLSIRPALRSALAENLRKVDRFLSRYAVAYADWPVAPVDPFFNINTPDDLAAAERILSTPGDRNGIMP